jgi:adenylosuccinate synthase
VVGVQWGDEGKGKIVDILSEKSDFVVRYQGGGNAGHTVVVNNEKFVLHLIPSGILHTQTTCLLTNGVVFDPIQFFEELDNLHSRGVNTKNRIFISDRIHLVMPYHKLWDVLSEEKLGDQKIGTTGRGIGPCYADKSSRIGIRLVDFLNKNVFIKRLESALREKNLILERIYEKPQIKKEEIIDTWEPFRAKLKEYALDTAKTIREAICKNKTIVFEGAQGSLLDVDFGTYPFVTASNSDACGLSAGTGVPFLKPDAVIGIAKAYVTRVGSGPFPSEIKDELGQKIREIGNEYGATTGRPRRCGWFDVVSTRYAVQLNQVSSIALTKLDVLGKLQEFKACHIYECNGKAIDNLPSDMEALDNCRGKLVDFNSWSEDISLIKKYEKLPDNAMKYIRFLEKTLGVPIQVISVSSDRKDTIFKNGKII